MKKIYSLMLVLLAVSISVNAASYSKLYINPGHGGFTDNDRQTAMPAVNGVKFTETQGCFWESEGNTYRAWGVEYFWKKRVNSNVKLSRYENTQAGDKTLSVIAKESNSYGGAFMSLHTNAGTDNANYMIIMCGANGKGTTSAKNPTSLKMAKDAAYWQGGEATSGLSTKGYTGGKANFQTNKSYKTDRGMTDRAFYSGEGLGVLNTNIAPGYLAESWFHDYRPEAFRLMSVGYNYYLAWQLMRAYLDSPGLDGVKLYPIIFGDIRDLSKSCGYSNYATRGRDKYLAINGAKVTLRNTANGGTKTYTTDKFNNGFYTFYDCVPGATYEITVVSPDGKKQIKKTITVTGGAEGEKGTQHQVNFDMNEATAAVGMNLSESIVKFDKVYPGESASEEITVSATGLSSTISISSNNELFTVSATSLPTSGGKFSIKFSPKEVGTSTATITLKSGTITKTISVTGVCRNKPIWFNPGWYACQTDLGWTNNRTNLDNDKWHYSNIRTIAYGAGKLYLSCPDTGKIHVINARTGEYITKLDMTGVEGGAAKFCDIKYVGGKVVVSSIANTSVNELKVYAWDNDAAAPKCILNTTMPTGYDRVGDTFYIKGDLNNGGIYYAGHNASGYNSIVCYPIVNGVVSTTATITAIANNEINLGNAPRIVAENSGKYWVDGSRVQPMLLDADGQVLATVPASAIYGNETAYTDGNAFKSFTFKGVTYGMATKFGANFTNGSAALFDASNGWADALYINSYPLKGLGTTNLTTWSTSIEVAVNGDKGVEAWIHVQGQGLVYVNYGELPSSNIEDVKAVITVDKENIAMEAIAKESSKATVSVGGKNLTSAIDLHISGEGASAFSVSETSMEVGGDVEITFAPTKAGTFNAILTVASEGAESKIVELVGNASANLNELGELTLGWEYSTAASSMPSWIVNDNTTANIRSIAVANDKLYILQNKGVGTPSVDVVNAYTGASVGELNLTGVAGGIVNLSSLVAVDGVVLGSNVGLSASEAASRIESEPETFAGVELETLKVYKWTSDNTAPQVIISDKTHAAMSTGAKISFSGNMTNGRIWFTNDAENAVLYYEIKNGVVAQSPVVINLMSGTLKFHAEGENTSAWGSGSVNYNEDGTFWVDFKDDLPTLFSAPVADANGVLSSVDMSHVQSGVVGGSRFGSDFKVFGYKEKQYAVATTYFGRDSRQFAEDGTTVTSGADDRLRQGAFTLIDITNGAENVTSNMGIYPANGLGNFKNDHFNTTLCVNSRQTGVDVWVCVYGQGVAYYYYGEDGITGVENLEVEVNIPAEYYNLQGVKVVNPSNGLFIKKQGDKVTKVIL